jgi:hypothetical protein
MWSSPLLRVEAGAEQVQRPDRVTGVDIRLLFDHVPAVADPERGGPYPHPPRQVQPSADFADGRVDQFEIGRVAEPGGP